MKRVNWLGNAALAVLLLLDLALVALVFTHKGGQVAGDTVPLTSTGSSSSTGPAESTAAPRATLVAGLLSVVDAKTVWSATKGTCGKGGATVSVSKDSGANWTAVKEQPYGALTRLDASSDRAAFVVGADSTCKLAIRSTSTGGETWRDPSTVSTSWALDLADATLVHSTSGTTSTPCGTVHVTAFARSSDSAATVLCDDASTRTTTDAGQKWSNGPSLSGVAQLGSVLSFAAAGSGSSARLVVASPATDCAGVAISTSTGGKDFVRAACVTPVAATTLPVALAQQGDSVGAMWLLVGTDLWRASGSFTAWAKAS
ncbi:MAG: hypothetical protein ABI131_12130 [Nostocoides sp.]